MYAQVTAIFTCILIGYIYEYFGRKIPITIFTLGMAGLLCYLPHVGDDELHITMVRVLASICCKATLQNPLMQDMIKKDTRAGAEG